MNAISIIGIIGCFIGVMAVPVAFITQIYLQNREERKAKEKNA